MKRLYSAVAVILTVLILCVFASCGAKPPVNDGDIAYEKTGSGSVSFKLEVYGTDGSVKGFNVSTDKTTVGAALLEYGIIAGEEGQYGLYVKTVNGETLDYEKDGKYWAFYINGEYAATGVDSTDITQDAVYALKAE